MVLSDKTYRLREYFVIFLLGAIGYSLIEILYRGYTHWSMALAGGICFCLIYLYNTKYNHQKLWVKCVVGALIITAVEFTIGCIVNLMFGMNVWDYSKLRLNILGQVSLLFSAIWFLLCIPLVFFSNFLRNRLAAHA